MTSNNEIVMDIDESYLIETNEQILRRYKENTGKQVWIEVFHDNLACIFPKVNSVGNSGNKKKDLIEKASYIMATIPFFQPFSDGNRRTGIIAAGTFLHDDGYDLDITLEDDNLELRELLRSSYNSKP